MKEIAYNAWLAGFWEGEGCLYNHCAKSYTVVITQTFRDRRTTEILMRELCHRFGGHLSYYKPAKKHHSPYMRWKSYTKRNVLNFLKAIEPYCQLRKIDVQKAIKDLKCT